jgi:hypothetical protein
MGSWVRILLFGRGGMEYDNVFLYLYFCGEEEKLRLVSSALKDLQQMSHSVN